MRLPVTGSSLVEKWLLYDSDDLIQVLKTMDHTLLDFKFLDLTDINEEERKYIQQVLNKADARLELPWDTPENDCHTDCSLQKSEVENVATATETAAAPSTGTPVQEANSIPAAATIHHVRETAPQPVPTPPGQSPYHGALPHSQPPVVSIPPPPPSATVPPPAAMTTVYQMVGPPLPNVFVSNLTTNVNVHGYNSPPYARHISPQPAYQVPEVNTNSRENSSSTGRRQKSGKLGSSRRQEIQQHYRGHDVQADASPAAPYHIIPVVHHYPYYPHAEHTPPQHAAAAAAGPPFFMPVYHTPVYPQYHQQPASAAPVVYSTDVPQQPPAETVEAMGFSPNGVGDERSVDAYCVEPSHLSVVEAVSTVPPISTMNRPETVEYNQVSEIISDEGLQADQLYDASYSTVNVEVSGVTNDGSVNFSSGQKVNSDNSYVEIERKDTLTPVEKAESDENVTVTCKGESLNTVIRDEVNVKTSVPISQETNLANGTQKSTDTSKPSNILKDPVLHKTSSGLDITTSITRRSGVNTSSALINSDEVSQQSTPGSGRSWASLFSPNQTNTPQALSNSVIHGTTKPFATVRPFVTAASETANDGLISNHKPQDAQAVNDVSAPAVDTKNFPQLTKSAADSPHLYRLGEFLSQYQLDHRAISLQPRGLTNRSNWCYINSTLQALLACPPFYNLMKALPISSNRMSSSPTPIIDSIVQFVNEFQPMSVNSRVGRKEKAQRKDDGTIEVLSGNAFEPSYIYKMLNCIRSNAFKVEGRQEDAEEFLSCLLNALNDEMQELIKLVQDGTKSNMSNGDIANGDASQSQDEDETAWKEMGPKNRGSITRRADFGRTPISDIFRGQLRSRVQRAGDEFTDNVQPFFTLQLDIEKAHSVKDALELLVGKDQLEGVTCSKTNQQIEAWQQVTLEQLPYVLVLHLKWFDYKLDGCSKIVKTVEFPIDLKVDTKLMSHKKGNARQKQYKLFAVVYHDGKEATKGHYVTDVFHVGYGSWVRFDDSSVKAIQEVQLLHPRSPRVPYLLYYRRCDTIGSSTVVPPLTNSTDRTR